MNNSRHNEPAAMSISLGDIYFVVFRHKWKILLLTLAGLVAATGYYFKRQPPYQSEAELFIRYISDSRNMSPTDDNSRVTSQMNVGQGLMNSEVDILNSFDIATQVATNIGPERILAKYGGGNDAIRAAVEIRKNLRVAPSQQSSVMHITYLHPDPALVQPVLNEIIRTYLEKHAQVHQAIGISDDLLTDQITQLRGQIAATDEELRIAKTNAGIIDMADSQKSYSEEVSRIRRELFQAEAELAGHESLVPAQAQDTRPTNSIATNAIAATPAPVKLPSEITEQYQTACTRQAFLQKKENDYLMDSGFTPENNLVKEVHAQLAAVIQTKQDLEAKYPSLTDLPVETAAPTPGLPTPVNLLAALPLRVKILQQQLMRLQSDAARLDEAEARINDLLRKKQVQESSYKYFANSLEEARINEALGPGHVSNINRIQQPSPPYKDFAAFYKKVCLLIFGGLGAGLAWAFLIEFFLDHSVKRAGEVEGKLHLPCFLSIPDLGQNKRAVKAAAARRQLAAAQPNGDSPAAAGLVPATHDLEANAWHINHALDTHYDALRDRLVLYFESINLTRKPKLVAITSTNRGAGVSTIAAGLAASLSETGDGRVLLVDMNREHGAAQQFFNGQPSCKLDDALLSDKRDHAMVKDNLYVVSESSHSDQLTRVLPKRFATLVPQLKASDYDYIIFDMPPVTQTSITTRLAGFMDTVMLVIESEKTDREVVQQANALLSKSKANVSAILNKTRQYVPSRLVHDINSKM